MLSRSIIFLTTIFAFIGLQAQSVDEPTEIEFKSNISIKYPSDQQVQHLFKLCKLWGLAKYKHPKITSGNIDWDKKLFRYLALTANPHFDDSLYKALPPLGQEEKVIPLSQGLGWIKRDSLFSKAIQSYLLQLAQIAAPEQQQYIEPGRWNITPKFKENKYPSTNWTDDGLKLLTLFRYWNIIEYFFPYKSLMEKDWDEVLYEYIPKILSTNSELSFKLSLLELISEINDGHAGIHNDPVLDQHFGKNQIPIELKLIGKKAYVVRLFEGIKGRTELVVGDEILEIDSRPLFVLTKHRIKYISASTEAAKTRILSEWLLRTNKSQIEVVVNREGRLVPISLPTIKYNTVRYVQRNIASHRELSEKIAYIYPGSLKPGELDSLLSSYKDKASIIFDYRCYPAVNIQNKLPNYLLPFPIEAFKSTRYSKDQLGEFNFTTPYNWGERNEAYYKGNFVILVNEYTQSQPEFESLIYTQAPSVTIIGSSTAGAIGNWTPIQLPGGILTSISGNGIFRYDESPVQRIGIIPDIYVSRTVKGVKNNRDEILLKAIQYCNQQ